MASARLFRLISVLGFAHAAFGVDFEFDLRRLGNPNTQGPNADAGANGKFRSFARQMGAVVTSSGLRPAQTLGSLGFQVALESSYTSMAASDFEWPTKASFSGSLFLPALSVRKGLPYSLELGAKGSWLGESRMGVASVDLRWAVNEGFSALPDIVIGGYLTALLGARDMSLTVGGTSLNIGHRFVIKETLSVSPFVGWNLALVSAETSLFDFRVTQDNASSDALPLGDPSLSRYTLGSLGSNSHNRFFGGAEAGFGWLRVSAELSYSVLGRFRDAATNGNRDVPGVFAFNSSVGAAF
jgi:hypothetical protein